MDLKAVHFSPKEVTLKPGESKTIEVVIERGPGFNKNVTLSLTCSTWARYMATVSARRLVNEAASQGALTGSQTKGVLVLKAAADAKPATKQLVPVLAHVSINFVMKCTYAAEPFYVTVTPP